MRYDTSMTSDASMWNGAVAEVASCVINNVLLYYNIRNTFGLNLHVDFLSFLCCMYLYICLCFICIVIFMHSFHSAHLFILYNSVIYTKSFNILI